MTVLPFRGLGPPSLDVPGAFAVTNERAWADLDRRIVACERCPRLRTHCRRVARNKRAAFLPWDYWGRPAPGFGDPQAALVLLGLAPAAHGTNRTGRMFTGDRSGDFLYSALFRAGFANQPFSISRDDGLALKGCFITAAARCAPPGNRPSPGELSRCRPFLLEELRLLGRARALLALGRVAFEAYMEALREEGALPRSGGPEFRHGASLPMPAPWPRLFISYHPSQQNTQTGKLTAAMFDRVLADAKRYISAG